MDKQFLHDALIASIGSLVVIPLFAYAMREKGKRLILPLAVLFDGKAGELKGMIDWTLRGRFRRRPVAITVRTVGFWGARSVRLEVICSAALRFVITRRNVGDSLLRALGMLRDLQVGDAFLDTAYRFRASAPDRFGPWVQKMDIRRHIESLFDEAGMEYVSLNDGELRCGYTTGQFHLPSVGDTQLILEAFTVIAESLEAQHKERWALES